MLENLIIGIVVMVLSVIGQSIIGIVETLYSSYFSGAIEYGLSDSDNQRRMRHSSIIIVTLLFVLSYVFLMTSSLVVVYVINKLDNKLTDILIIVISGFCTFFSIFYLYIEKKEPVVKKIFRYFFMEGIYIILSLTLCYLFYHVCGEKKAEFLLLILVTMATIAEIFIVSDNKIVKWVRRLIKKNSEKTVCLYQRLIFIFCTISLLGGTYFNLFKVYLNDKYKLVITVSFIKEYIFSSIIFGIILLFIILVRVSKSYNKMTNLAFLYGEKNDKTSQGENNKSTIYIYTRIGNQFLYEDKDRLQYNKKEFDDELRKIKEKIKKKKWDKKVRREREKAIDRLKPYSVYIEIEEAKKEFNNLNTCIDTCDDKEKRDNTTSEEKKKGIVIVLITIIKKVTRMIIEI